MLHFRTEVQPTLKVFFFHLNTPSLYSRLHMPLWSTTSWCLGLYTAYCCCHLINLFHNEWLWVRIRATSEKTHIVYPKYAIVTLVYSAHTSHRFINKKKERKKKENKGWLKEAQEVQNNTAQGWILVLSFLESILFSFSLVFSPTSFRYITNNENGKC